jgi:putative peptidoglycan lipid II flippase
MHGKFSYEDVVLTYYSLVTASAGIIFISALRITTPAFYAMKDTKIPLASATVALFVNLHAGLTLANTLSAIVQMSILMIFLNRKTGGIDFRKILRSIVKFVIASLVMAGLIIFISSFADWEKDSMFRRCIFLFIIVTGGCGVYFTLCYLLRSDEMLYFIRAIRKRISPGKPKP